MGRKKGRGGKRRAASAAADSATTSATGITLVCRAVAVSAVALAAAHFLPGRRDGAHGPETAAKAEALRRRAIRHATAGRLDRAIPLFEAAVRASPSLGETHSNLAFAYKNAGRLRDAVDAAVAGSVAAPADPGVWARVASSSNFLAKRLGTVDGSSDRSSGLQRIANAAEKIRLYRQALAAGRRALQLQPTHFVAAFNAGMAGAGAAMVIFQDGDDHHHQQDDDHHHQQDDDDDDDDDLRDQDAGLALAAEAEDMYAVALRLHPNHGGVLFEAGSIAAAAYRALLRGTAGVGARAQRDAEAAVWRARAEGRYREAAAVLRAGAVPDNTDGGDAVTPANALFRVASLIYEGALADKGQDKDADADEAKGAITVPARMADAMALSRRATELDPSLAKAFALLSKTTFAASGVPAETEVLAAARRATQLDPDGVPAWDALSEALGKLGKTELAPDAYVRVAELDPKNAVRWAMAADASWVPQVEKPSLAKMREVVAMYEKALALDPDQAVALYQLPMARGELRWMEAEAEETTTKSGDGKHADAPRHAASVAAGMAATCPPPPDSGVSTLPPPLHPHMARISRLAEAGAVRMGAHLASTAAFVVARDEWRWSRRAAHLGMGGNAVLPVEEIAARLLLGEAGAMCGSPLSPGSPPPPPVPQGGLILEFGVWMGTTINAMSRRLARVVGPERLIHGFDSFEGLPTDWAGRDGMVEGRFSTGGVLPAVDDDVVRLHKGWFSDTLDPFLDTQQADVPVALAHMDANLYSSQKEVLEALAPRLVAGSLLLFDDFFYYQGWEMGESRAWREVREAFGIACAWVAHSDQKVLVQVVAANNDAGRRR